jgi:long-chain acyl-CoA synthetase
MPLAPLHHALEAAAQRYGDRAALFFGDDRWTFAELDRRADAFAAELAATGVGRGDRVVVMSGNRPEFVAIVNALSKLGAATVLVSPAWKQREVGAAVELTAPTYAVADGAGVGVLNDLLGAGRVRDVDLPTLDSTAPDETGNRPEVEVAVDDDAVLVFSSGTTGLPKAVRHTHLSLGHAVDHWVAALGLTADDRFQVATPPSHILGLLNLLTAAAAGAAVRLHPRFDLDEVLRRIESDRMTLEMAVAPIALAMANHPRLEEFDLSSLRYIMWGATPVTPAVAAEVTRRSGVRWLPAYGASELPVIAVNPVREPQLWRLDSAGLPPEGVELRVIDLDSREVLPPGGVGEIQVRSPSVMAGYLPDDANRDAFEDGWYRTGDVGWLEPDSWVHLTDRSKEMIKVNGFQVAPAEIEAVLHAHPGVRDCAVFGVPDERAGERPVAAVSLNGVHPVTIEDLDQLVADSLATYKHLRAVVVVDDIPRLPSGKVLRRTLRDVWAPRLQGCGTAAEPRSRGGTD